MEISGVSLFLRIIASRLLAAVLYIEYGRRGTLLLPLWLLLSLLLLSLLLLSLLSLLLLSLLLLSLLSLFANK